ncbi:DNA topology modulation protein [Streptococcus caprae]|uniref:DNA topology modulation protein n=1 Tax=Streptococcus caprae TaxID=1640501 RepID=A0ABV8CTC8_9STRE
MKIAIIGYSGGGKSTLAKLLANHYGLPKLHLDRLQFTEGWISRPQGALIDDLGTFLDKHKDWVIDGNYSFAFYDRRMAEADQIIFLNFSRWRSLWRVSKRYWQNRGHSRDDMAAGCPEKLDWEFIRWVLYDGRTRQAKLRYKAIQQQYPEKFIILKTQSDIDQFLKTLA